MGFGSFTSFIKDKLVSPITNPIKSIEQNIEHNIGSAAKWTAHAGKDAANWTKHAAVDTFNFFKGEYHGLLDRVNDILPSPNQTILLIGGAIVLVTILKKEK